MSQAPHTSATEPKKKSSDESTAAAPDKEENNALAVNHHLAVVEDREWEKQWRQFKNTAFNSKIFENMKETRENVEDFIEGTFGPCLAARVCSVRSPAPQRPRRTGARRPILSRCVCLFAALL